MVIWVEAEPPLQEAVTVTTEESVDASNPSTPVFAVAVNVVEELPAATVTVAGTVSLLESLLVIEMV